MDADDIGAIFATFIGLLIFALVWWCDREHKRLTESGHLSGKVTAIRRSQAPAERRPPS